MTRHFLSIETTKTGGQPSQSVRDQSDAADARRSAPATIAVLATSPAAKRRAALEGRPLDEPAGADEWLKLPRGIAFGLLLAGPLWAIMMGVALWLLS